ncbi:MAG: NAD(P)/FAD-dependent oxidoreductase, partial [Desulfurococcales archaeon]|nr:NAD(P)/FAD-dependent oxidoreductase [Desulfurococcales archaeon]
MKRLDIIGGGPAGVGAALAARGHYDRIMVYEAQPRLAVKPCGRGIPVLGDIGYDPPRSVVYHRIRRAIMYVDGEFLFELRDVFNGYIVDKTGFLEDAFSRAGAEVVYGAKFNPELGRIRVGGSTVEPRPESSLFAGGHPYYTGEKILAVQYRLATNQFDDADHLEIYFDTGILGYYYVFPAEPGTVDVGVGGFMDYKGLKFRLDKFIEQDERLRTARRLKLEGAKIAAGGIAHGRIGGLEKIGEAAGYVLPLTGEGIRPSMLSGMAAARSLAKDGDPRRGMEDAWITRAIRVQRRILEAVKGMEPPERRSLLKELTPRVHAEVALGRLDKGV